LNTADSLEAGDIMDNRMAQTKLAEFPGQIPMAKLQCHDKINKKTSDFIQLYILK